MAKVKGTNLVNLRKYLRKNKPEQEKQLLANLPDTLRDVYFSAVTTVMVPLDMQVAIYEEAARLIYPGRPKPMFELGKLLSESSFNGVYKVFMKIPTVSHIAAKADQIWQTFFDEGRAAVENITSNSLDYRLYDFPDYPLSMIDYCSGYLVTLMTSTGAENIEVKVNTSNRAAWLWHIEWR